MTGMHSRMPLPRQVVLLALPRAVNERISEALCEHLTVTAVAGVHECTQVLQKAVGVCVLVWLPRVDEEAQAAHLLEYVQQFPNTPFITLIGERDANSRWVSRLLEAGVSELLIWGAAVQAQVLLAALSRCEAETIAARIWKRAGLEVSDALSAILRPAIRLAHAPISLRRLACANRVHERSLRKYCFKHELPSPQWIIGWARMLVAAYYLDESGRSIQSVADLIQFPSAVVFANTTRKYTGKTPTQLRVSGAVDTVRSLLEIALMRKSTKDE